MSDEENGKRDGRTIATWAAAGAAIVMGIVTLANVARSSSNEYVTAARYAQDEEARRELRAATREEMRSGFARIEAQLIQNRIMLDKVMAALPREEARIRADVVKDPD